MNDKIQAYERQTHFPLKGNTTLSEETIRALQELGEVLLQIRRRMADEGFELINGNFQKKVSAKKHE